MMPPDFVELGEAGIALGHAIGVRVVFNSFRWVTYFV